MVYSSNLVALPFASAYSGVSLTAQPVCHFPRYLAYNQVP